MGIGSRNQPFSSLIPGWMAQSAVVHRALQVSGSDWLSSTGPLRQTRGQRHGANFLLFRSTSALTPVSLKITSCPSSWTSMEALTKFKGSPGVTRSGRVSRIMKPLCETSVRTFFRTPSSASTASSPTFRRLAISRPASVFVVHGFPRLFCRRASRTTPERYRRRVYTCRTRDPRRDRLARHVHRADVTRETPRAPGRNTCRTSPRFASVPPAAIRTSRKSTSGSASPRSLKARQPRILASPRKRSRSLRRLGQRLFVNRRGTDPAHGSVDRRAGLLGVE